MRLSWYFWTWGNHLTLLIMIFFWTGLKRNVLTCVWFYFGRLLPICINKRFLRNIWYSVPQCSLNILSLYPPLDTQFPQYNTGLHVYTDDAQLYSSVQPESPAQSYKIEKTQKIETEQILPPSKFGQNRNIDVGYQACLQWGFWWLFCKT